MCDVLGRFLPLLLSHISRPSLDLFPSLALSPFLPPPPVVCTSPKSGEEASVLPREKRGRGRGTRGRRILTRTDGRRKRRRRRTLEGKRGRSKEMISAGGKEEQATERKLPCVFPLFLVCPFFCPWRFWHQKGLSGHKKGFPKKWGEALSLGQTTLGSRCRRAIKGLTLLSGFRVYRQPW